MWLCLIAHVGHALILWRLVPVIAQLDPIAEGLLKAI
jgi:hypothetical protein